MLVITGWNSQIAIELRQLVIYRGHEGAPFILRTDYDELAKVGSHTRLMNAGRYFFCAGLLLSKSVAQMTADERAQTYQVNYYGPRRCCDEILAANPKARICVMGSESAYRGSFNECYANSKTLLHQYVESKALKPDQQLVAVSPNIVYDAGMTLRRTDRDRLDQRLRDHPKQTFVSSMEVSKLVRFLLYEDAGYITNTVIRMHGGEHLK